MVGTESKMMQRLPPRLCSLVMCLVLLVGASCQRRYQAPRSKNPPPPPSVLKPYPANVSLQLKQLVESAIDQTKVTTGYDPSYVKIDYPGGDVPIETGVCSDVVVRAFRKAGIDLQKEIHEDMGRAWSAYPTKVGGKRS